VSPLEMRLLLFLVRTPGKMRSRKELLTEVWGYHPEVSSRTLDTHVKRIRDKFGASGDLIQTVRGVGFAWQCAGSPPHRRQEPPRPRAKADVSSAPLLACPSRSSATSDGASRLARARPLLGPGQAVATPCTSGSSSHGAELSRMRLMCVSRVRLETSGDSPRPQSAARGACASCRGAGHMSQQTHLLRAETDLFARRKTRWPARSISSGPSIRRSSGASRPGDSETVGSSAVWRARSRTSSATSARAG